MALAPRRSPRHDRGWSLRGSRRARPGGRDSPQPGRLAPARATCPAGPARRPAPAWAALRSPAAPAACP